MYMLKILVYIIWGQTFGLLHNTDQTELSCKRSHGVLTVNLCISVSTEDWNNWNINIIWCISFIFRQITMYLILFPILQSAIYTSWKTSVKQKIPWKNLNVYKNFYFTND